MAPLAVDPEVLSAAGSAVVATGDGLAANLTVLRAGFAANTGQDTAGTVFGLAYQSAAESLLTAAAAAINACRHSGALVQLSASNYSRAEAASTLGGGAGVLSPPADPVKITAPGPPGTLGPGEPPPVLWAVVQSFVHDFWPDGDVAGLHAAAARWRGFGAAISGVQDALNASKSLVAGQRIPEGEKVASVLSGIVDGVNSIGAQCGKLAATLDDFANEVSDAQNHIRDLLHRLGSLANLAHDVVLIFEGDAFDEIEKIAEDINAVLHQFGREARACEQSLNMGMQVIDGLVVGMEKFMRGQFTHFLGQDVGNGVATVFDTWVNTGEGVVKGLVQMVEGIEQLDPRWFLLDPEGATETWNAMTKTGLLNHVLNPQGAVEADKQMFRALLHLDDWRADRPGLGFGENAFDVATLFLPGVGEAGAGVKGAAAGARAAEEGAEAADAAGAAGRAAEAAGAFAAGERALGDIGEAGSGLTTDLEGLGGDLPKAEPPVGGQPVALPPGEVPGAPVESAPHPVDPAPAGGPHEPAPTGGAREPVDAASAPPGAAHEPAAAAVERPHEPIPAVGRPHQPPSAPGVPARDLPAASPRLVDHVPARPHASRGAFPAEATPAPAAAHSPSTAPAASPAPRGASAPAFTPSSGRPAELPAPHGGGPRGAEDGLPPGDRPDGSPLRGRDPHGHGDRDPREGHRHRQKSHDGEHHGPDGGDSPDVSTDGLDAEKRDEIIAMPKGSRPDPSEYLSPQYIENHLNKFTDGATRFMPQSNLAKYGIAQRDGTAFVMPKAEADAMIDVTRGNARAMENELGLPDGFLDSNRLVRIDIADPEDFDLRMPSGNEAGANEQWVPGGHLPNGASEAVINGESVPPGGYTVTAMSE